MLRGKGKGVVKRTPHLKHGKKGIREEEGKGERNKGMIRRGEKLFEIILLSLSFSFFFSLSLSRCRREKNVVKTKKNKFKKIHMFLCRCLCVCVFVFVCLCLCLCLCVCLFSSWRQNYSAFSVNQQLVLNGLLFFLFFSFLSLIFSKSN